MLDPVVIEPGANRQPRREPDHGDGEDDEHGAGDLTGRTDGGRLLGPARHAVGHLSCEALRPGLSPPGGPVRPWLQGRGRVGRPHVRGGRHSPSPLASGAASPEAEPEAGAVAAADVVAADAALADMSRSASSRACAATTARTAACW